MTAFNTPARFGGISQFLHWTTVVAVGIAWFLGMFDDIFSRGPARAAALSAHIFAGLSILALLVVRALWRLIHPPPPAVETRLGPMLDRAGRLMHYVLYAMLVAVPLSGIILQFARGDALPLFGLAQIASPWPADRAFSRAVKEVHEVLANGFIILVALHAAAALFHHWILRDGTLQRMLPRLRRR